MSDFESWLESVNSIERYKSSDISLVNTLKLTGSYISGGISSISTGFELEGFADKCLDIMMAICMADRLVGTNRLSLSISEVLLQDSDSGWSPVIEFLNQSRGMQGLNIDEGVHVFKVHRLRILADTCLILLKENHIPEFDSTTFVTESAAKVYNSAHKSSRHYSSNADESDVWALLFEIYDFLKKALSLGTSSNNVGVSKEFDELLEIINTRGYSASLAYPCTLPSYVEGRLNSLGGISYSEVVSDDFESQFVQVLSDTLVLTILGGNTVSSAVKLCSVYTKCESGSFKPFNLCISENVKTAVYADTYLSAAFDKMFKFTNRDGYSGVKALLYFITAKHSDIVGELSSLM